MSDLKQELAVKASQTAMAKKQPTMKDYIVAMSPEIKKALPQMISPERFTRMALTIINMNPAIAECSPKSFLGALMTSAQLGLEPNTPLGQAYIIPYVNKGQKEASFQLGYKGILELAYRSGEFKSIYAHVVYENDFFEFEYGLEQSLKHVPSKQNRGKAEWVYAVFQLKNGGFGFDVMSIEDIKTHAKKYSRTFNSQYSSWATNFEEMAKKTVIKKVLKYAPMKVEINRQIAEDETIKSEIKEDMTEVASEVIDWNNYTVEEANEQKEN